MSDICAVIGRTRHRMVQMEIKEAARRGAKLIEVRLDFLTKAPDFKRLLDGRSCPIIATLRRPEEGGRWKGTEAQRQTLIRQAIVAGFDYIDLESEIAGKIPRFGKVKRIVSYHDFDGVPEDLEERYQAMCALDPDVVKLAVTPQKLADNFRVMRLLREAPKPTIVLCMGELGTWTRVLNARFGAPFTYASFTSERAIAPGIISFRDLQTIYRYESVGPETRVFGVVGDPVGHSLSPHLHNGAYQHLGINAVYVPFRVPRGELPEFLTASAELGVEGLSVTLPHKEAAAAAASWQHPDVAKVGAANTLVRDGDGWKAYNTDLQAAIGSLKAALERVQGPEVPPLPQRSVLILGAGGAARAIAHGLTAEGCKIFIANRTPERADKLAAEIGCRAVPWEGRHSVECDTVVNCTSVGLSPNVDDSPLHSSFLRPDMVIFDTIYTPETTRLLREAQERGCHIISGVDMFVRQASLQFKLFTGQDPPCDVMTQIARRALSPVNYAKQEAREPGDQDERGEDGAAEAATEEPAEHEPTNAASEPTHEATGDDAPAGEDAE